MIWPNILSWIDPIWTPKSYPYVFSSSVSNSRRYSKKNMNEGCLRQGGCRIGGVGDFAGTLTYLRYCWLVLFEFLREYEIEFKILKNPKAKNLVLLVLKAKAYFKHINAMLEKHNHWTPDGLNWMIHVYVLMIIYPCIVQVPWRCVHPQNDHVIFQPHGTSTKETVCCNVS